MTSAKTRETLEQSSKFPYRNTIAGRAVNGGVRDQESFVLRHDAEQFQKQKADP